MGKVLMAIDDSAGSKAAVLAVYRNLRPRPEDVVLVHVVQNDGMLMSSDRQRTTTTDRLTDQFVSSYKQEIEKTGSVTLKAVVKNGIPAEEILKTAGEEHADVIIMGRNRSGFLRPAAGRIVREVEQAATVPVLVGRTSGPKKSITYGWRGAYVS